MKLTYKDIETILGIENNILHECNDKSQLVIEAYPKGEDYYGEILRRFNNQRIKPQRMISAEAKEAMYSKPTDLEKFIIELSKQFPDVSFAKLSRIAVRVAKWAKPRWSEEDKKHIGDIIDYLDDYYSFAKDEYEDVADGVLNEIRWLQSI